MPVPYKVGSFVSSLATASIHRLLAKALVRVAPSGLMLTEIVSRICRYAATTMTTAIRRRRLRLREAIEQTDVQAA